MSTVIYGVLTLILIQLSLILRIMKRELNILIALISIWCGMILLAPLTAGDGGVFGVVSQFLYRLFHSICHQFDSHSFHLHGHKFGVCIRCTAIYSSFLTGFILFRMSETFRLKKFDPLHSLIIACLPMCLDVMLSIFTPYESTTASRLITGGWFGCGVSIVLRDSLVEIMAGFLQRLPFTHAYEYKAR